MDFDTPLSRNEAILQNILGADNVLVAPQSRIEAILQAILNDSSYDADALSRMEELLLAIKDGGTWDKTPISRNEEILVAKLNGETYDKAPQSRIEELLIEWCNAPVWVEKTVSGSIVTITDAIAAAVIDLKVAVNAVQQGSGTPSPDNVRPIVGVSEVNVSHLGKNIWGEGVGAPDVSSPGLYQGWKIRYNTNARLVLFDRDTTQDISGISLCISKNGKDVLGGVAWSILNGNIRNRNVTTNEYGYVSVYPTGNAALTKLFKRFYVMVVIDNDTYDTYVPYYKQLYTIHLGGTYYGGVLDVTSGVFRVTHLIKNMSEIDFSAYSDANNHVFRAKLLETLPNVQPPENNNVATTAICSRYSAYAYSPLTSSMDGKFAFSIATGNRMVFIDHDCNTVEDFMTANANSQIVYPLTEAGQFEVTLTPTQVELAIRQNTIFADSGDIEVTYKAQPQ